MRARAQWCVLEEDFLGGRLVIRDIGPWDRHPTVTNDAEAVVRTLVETNRVAATGRIFYFDSEGDGGELLHDAGRFLGFRWWDGGAA